MTRLEEITDWGLADTLAANHAAVVVAIVHSQVPFHGHLVRSLKGRSRSFDPVVAFRRIDIWENPSLVVKLCLKRLPAVLLYTDGTERKRWAGAVDLDEVMEAVAAVLQKREGA